MIRTLALIVLLAFSGSASAQSLHEQWTVCVAFPGHCDKDVKTSMANRVKAMPAQYRGPYRGKVTVTYLSPAALQWKCIRTGAIACTTGRHTPGRCPIYIDRTLSPQMKQIAYQHEIAHCKGYRHG